MAAIIAFIGGEEVRRNNEVFAAWTTITTAHEQGGSGGRKRALEFLNSRPLRFPWIWGTIDLFEDGEECKEKLVFGRRWKREPLVGLSAPGAYLVGIHLCGASLELANLQDVWLTNANLQGASLFSAKLQDAFLAGANLQDTNLADAKLQDAFLADANLQDAFLARTNLQDAGLWRANLQGAFLLDTKGLTHRQIKVACFWDEAIYKGEFIHQRGISNQKKDYVVKELENIKFIEKLKQETSSNPTNRPDCSRWKK